jgi:2-acylglycerol O-acyltransferase 2
VSVKPSPEYEKELKHDRLEDKRQKDADKKLASGRQAGKRWKESAIRFAPLNVPLQRRLQTLMVLFHTLSIALFVSTFFFLCAIPLFWPLLIPYMIYCLSSKASTSGTLSHRSEFLRSLPVWSLFASYFPARLHRTQELPPTRKYIFGYHPHGIISHGAFAAFATEALGFSQLFPGIKNTLLTLDSNFRIPIYRDYALAMGLASVSRESCENLLSKGGPNKEGMGRAITIVVGGARESLDAQPHSLRLVLKRRKGFVKMAMRTGADLVPVLAFGENDLYDQVTSDSHPVIHKMQLLVKKILGFTIPLFHARGVFNYDVGLMPYRRPLNIVVGRPIKVNQTERPEQGEIDRVHSEYVAELERLWDLWKDDFAPDREGELEILE